MFYNINVTNLIPLLCLLGKKMTIIEVYKKNLIIYHNE